MVRDSSLALLEVPAIYRESQADFTVAKTPPRIDFGLVDLSGMGPGAPWGGWGDGIIGPDGGYYFSEGNHKGTDGANALILRYDRQEKTHKTILQTQEVCGWSDEEFGDGKVHGTPDIAPNGDMWLLTFYGPTPAVSDWGTRYTGGRLIHYNIYSKQAEYLGQPLPDDSWPMFRWDWQRHRLYAIGEYGEFHGGQDYKGPWESSPYAYGKILVYDTENRTLVHGEVPNAGGANTPDPIYWFRRSLLLDPQTGMLYGSECRPPHRIVRYDPATNRFYRMNSTLATAFTGQTQTKSQDGAFYLCDMAGKLYKFYPELDQVQPLGKSWHKGSRLWALHLSPGERYLYYVADLSMNNGLGLPVIQYDTKTATKKVLAFLSAYYMAAYNYGADNNYGSALSQDGSSLVLHANGKTGAFGYGEPAIFHIEIPASERIE